MRGPAVARSAHPRPAVLRCASGVCVEGIDTVLRIQSKLSIVFSTSLALALGACGSDSGTSDSGDESSESASSGEGEAGTGEGEASTTTSATTEDTSASETTGGFVPTDTSDSATTAGTGEPGPNGSMCGNDDECTSMICVDVAGFTGLCSECRTDQDCMDSGEGLNCSIGANGYFECGSGMAGTMCMSSDACDGDLVCAQVIDLGGLFNDQFCSECEDDDGCEAGEQCVPSYDLQNFTGERVCAEAGSLEQDALCDTGDQCMSGICGTADVMGFLQFGICSECESDGDCDAGQTCTPASADVLGGGGLAGGTCG